MQSNDDDSGFGLATLLLLVPVLLVLFVFLFMAQFRDWVGAFGVGGLIFVSSAMVGALLGFIFAVPRVATKEGADPSSDGKTRTLNTNTNLERISDWLTTMLVGVGLSQLTNLNGIFFQFRMFLAETAKVFGTTTNANAGILPAIGPFILVLGAAGGFLFMYLWTRLVLTGFFRKNEEMLSGVAAAAIRAAVGRTQNAPASFAPSAPSGSRRAAKPAVAPAKADFVVEPPQSPATTATLRRALEATTISKDDALEVMYELLYEPGGYRGVIQMSGELSSSPIAKRADYWFYLAAAFGQQMHHTEPGSDARQSARDNAMDAAHRAVRIDKSFRGRLWQISNPTSTDNDLSLLRDDDDFRRLVGQPTI